MKQNVNERSEDTQIYQLMWDLSIKQMVWNKGWRLYRVWLGWS